MKNPSKETGDRIRAWAIPRLVFTVCFLPEEEGILFNAKITKYGLPAVAKRTACHPGSFPAPEIGGPR